MPKHPSAVPLLSSTTEHRSLHPHCRYTRCEQARAVGIGFVTPDGGRSGGRSRTVAAVLGSYRRSSSSRINNSSSNNNIPGQLCAQHRRTTLIQILDEALAIASETMSNPRSLDNVGGSRGVTKIHTAPQTDTSDETTEKE